LWYYAFGLFWFEFLVGQNNGRIIEILFINISTAITSRVRLIKITIHQNNFQTALVAKVSAIRLITSKIKLPTRYAIIIRYPPVRVYVDNIIFF